MSVEEPNDPRSCQIANNQIQLTELARYEERAPADKQSQQPIKIVLTAAVIDSYQTVHIPAHLLKQPWHTARLTCKSLLLKSIHKIINNSTFNLWMFVQCTTTRCKQHWSRTQLPVSVCNCFLYFTYRKHLKYVCLTFWFSFNVLLVVFYPSFCILSQLLTCRVKKLKQEVLLDQCCLHLVKWSCWMLCSDVLLLLRGTFITLVSQRVWSGVVSSATYWNKWEIKHRLYISNVFETLRESEWKEKYLKQIDLLFKGSKLLGIFESVIVYLYFNRLFCACSFPYCSSQSRFWQQQQPIL